MYYSTQTNYLYRKDKRIKITNDVLHSLQEIKINRYEEYFYSKILKKRTKELFYLKNVLDQGIVNNFVFFSLPLYISIGVFVYTIYFINPKFIYNTSDLLTIILILNSLSYPLYRFPVFITCIIEAKVSCERICPFLNDKSISTTNLPFEFSQVDNIYKHNNKICLLGDIASGKSTFIKHIALSEKNGCCYTSQEHFIMNDTLRNNILFGDEYDEIKFKNVLNLTELDKDIEGFDAKEMKVCGVNGNMLSGGQKARVDIARALYKKNKYNVFLFDDAFASLNDKVARNVFMKGIVSYLGQQENNDNNINKLICSFSNLSFVDKSVLEFFDKFVYLVNGKMVFEGDYASFIQSTYYNKVISNSIEIKQETKNKTDVIN
jgi:ABC-type multidrug transport system fused ATPase/permease subunit